MIPAEVWRGNVLLLIVYAIIGCLLGLAAAVLLDRGGRLTPVEFGERSRVVLVLTLVVAFGVNVAFTPDVPVPMAEVLAVALIAMAVVWSARQSDDRDRLLRHPAIVSAMLLATGRLVCGEFANSSAFVATLVAVVGGLAIVGLTVVVLRFVARFHPGWLRSQPLVYAIEAFATLALVCCPALLSSFHAQDGAFAPVVSGKPDRPNIILISLDTVRADHMGIYGYARHNTPNLAALLKDSTLYTNFIAASSMTLSSHGSMFSGLYPHTHGAFMEMPDYPTGRPFPTGIPTAASILKSAGYRTAAAAANFGYLGPHWNLLRDFDSAWMPQPEAIINTLGSYLLRNRLRRLLLIDGVVQDFDRLYVSAAEMNHRALTLLDQSGTKAAPFFLFLNYMDAHFPYAPPPPFSDLYPGQDLSLPSWYADDVLLGVNEGRHVLQPTEHAHLVSQYDGAIAYMDDQLGKLILHLKRSGQYDRTMIMITSDHGEALAERGSLGHNISSYQDQIHVPLLIKYPRNTQSGTNGTLAGHVDLLPTILDVVGLPAAQGSCQGMSLLRLGDAAPRSLISERHDHGKVSYALISGSSKLIYLPNGKPELYDLSNDPNERHDLYQPDIASHAALKDKMEEWIRKTPRRYLSQAPIDPAELKRLKSLGYVQ